MRKKLLSGNEAIALGAYHAGVRVATAYPGTPSTEILEELARFEGVYAEWSPNEKVALEVGIGAALGGARTIVSMKHVGLNVAADPWMTLPYIGVNAGLVLVSADDPGMHSSQNEQDNRYYAKMASVPMLEPADSQEAYRMMICAYDISEKYDIPILFRVVTRICHSRSLVKYEDQRIEVDLEYEKDHIKRVMVPGHARLRHPILLEKMEALKEEAESFPFNSVEMRSENVGIITSGVSYQYAREAFPEASILKLAFTHPLPENLIRGFSSHFKRVYVVEELEPFLEENIKAMGIDALGKLRVPRHGELDPDKVGKSVGELIEMDTGVKGISWTPPAVKELPVRLEELPLRPPIMCAGCAHRGLFYLLSKLKLIVSSDIGCYTLSVFSPIEGIDCQVCMGASVGMALGLEKAFLTSSKNKGKERQVIVALGDSTFIHGGITGLIDIVYNRGTTTVIILDNRTTAMTGFQSHPGTGKTIRGEATHALSLEELCKAVGVVSVKVVDPWDLKATEKVIREEVASEHPSVIIARRACIQLERDMIRKPFKVNEEKCNECGLCMKLGCPALTRRNDKLHIVASLCAGCSLCAQVCRKDAIAEVE